MASYFKIGRLLLVCSVLLSTVSFVHAFNTNGPGWSSGDASFYITPKTITGSDGLTTAQLRDAFENAMDDWTGNSYFDFVKDAGSVSGINICPTVFQIDASNPANNDNGFGFAQTYCGGLAFQGNTLAVATTWRQGTQGDGPLLQAGIIFDSDKAWNIYTGPQGGTNTGFDFTRVAIHELGHTLGLAHSQFNSAIMVGTIGNLETIQQDDFNGAAFLYGAFDKDGDNVPNGSDNCFNIPNPGQENFNGDAEGDACDNSDGDTIFDDIDNCPLEDNQDQMDSNMDGVGDACDADSDGVRDDLDNCEMIVNPNQDNFDGDEFGDICDDDDDNDTILDIDDSEVFNRFICGTDDDGDYFDDGNGGDICDDCSSGTYNINNDGLDSDNDGLCNAFETDDDDDGVDDLGLDGLPLDNCPITYNPLQEDSDGNGIGDACDGFCFPIVASNGNVAVVCL